MDLPDGCWPEALRTRSRGPRALGQVFLGTVGTHKPGCVQSQSHSGYPVLSVGEGTTQDPLRSQDPGHQGLVGGFCKLVVGRSRKLLD